MRHKKGKTAMLNFKTIDLIFCRSPSITSNRDSIQSNDGSFTQPGGVDPPPVPPKSRSDNLNNDELSITDSFLENLGHARKKKAPPPPPPTPPKKPPLKPFE